MTDAVFTFINGAEYCKSADLQVYIKSLLECGFKGDKVIFTSEMPIEFRCDLVEKGFIISEFPKEEIYWLYRDRHLAYYNWNSGHDYRFIIQTDSRDTLFQKNPVEYLENRFGKEPGNHVLLTSEGFVHAESPTNTSNQGHYQKGLAKHQRPFANWPVINGGTVAGTGKRILYYDLAIWFAGLGRVARDGDQAITNYARYYFQRDESVSVADPKESTWCITGEGLNVKKYTPLPIDAYYLFHQWDRTSYADSIRRKYL